MIINTEKLLDLGFEVEVTGEEIHIFPHRDCVPTHELREAMTRVSSVMGFDEREADELWGAAHKIQVMSAVRKCSNW